MFLSLPGSPWNPAQQPGLGICHRFTVSNGVSGGTVPEAAAIAAAIELAAAIRIAAAARGRWPLKLFPCHYDASFSAAINVAAAIEVAAAIHRCDTIAAAAAPVSTVFPCFPLQGLSCG